MTCRLYLLNWMSQYSFQLCRVPFARIAEIDLVMFAAESNTISITILLREGSHPFHCGGFGGIGTNVHGLHAKSFLEICQPELREHFAITFLLADLFQPLSKNILCNYIWLQDHQRVEPVVLHCDIEHAILHPPQSLQRHDRIIDRVRLA